MFSSCLVFLALLKLIALNRLIQLALIFEVSRKTETPRYAISRLNYQAYLLNKGSTIWVRRSGWKGKLHLGNIQIT